jgi:hypothetical protein
MIRRELKSLTAQDPPASEELDSEPESEVES